MRYYLIRPRRWWWLLIALVAGSILALLLADHAHADGGAPNLAYIVGAGSDGQSLAIIDIAQRKVTSTTHLGGDPAGIVLSLDNRFAYITERGQNQVAVVDARTHQLAGQIAVGTAPQGIAIDVTTGATLYVTNSGSNSVSVIDGTKRAVLATISVGQQPQGISIAGVNTTISNYLDPQVYVADSGSDAVTVIAAHERSVLATIPVPGGPQNVVVPAVASVAYVTTRSGDIDIISLADHRFIGTLVHRPGDTFGMMDYDAVTNQVYVPDLTAGQVLVLAPASATGPLPTEPARTLSFTGSPAAVAITFDGTLGFVAQQGSGQVSMLDVAQRQTLATIAVGGAPHAVITGSYPPLLDRRTANVVGIVAVVVLFAAGVAFAAIVVRRAQKGQAGHAQ